MSSSAENFLTTVQTQAVEDIRARLFTLRDEGYRDFLAKLMPTVDKARVIGIRTPHLRALSKELRGSEAANTFLTVLPHGYYEEDNLHAHLIESERNFDRALALTDAFLPHIDNWATCDCFSPAVFRRHKEELLPHAERWMASSEPYIIRYGIGVHMRHFLGDAFRPDMPARLAAIRNDHYYVRMMVAWYFATALAKQPEAAWEILREGVLDPWTQNNAIGKARESRCIDAATKAELLRWKR